MAFAKRKEARVATAGLKRKSPIDALTNKFSALIEEQAAKLTDEEFKAAEKSFNRVVEKVRASRSAQHDKD
jgi:hypothetical protein